MPPIPELLRIKCIALQELCDLPKSMGQSRQTRGLPAALSVWFSKKGIACAQITAG